MKPHFHDILALTDQQPQWFMPDGTPRFIPFTPQEAGVYLAEVALVEICCQNCKHPFMVAITTDGMDEMRRNLQTQDRILPMEKLISINPDQLSYGDPPNIECCPAGPTMGSLALRIVEYWSDRRYDEKGMTYPLKRNPVYEIVLPDAYEYAEDIAAHRTMDGEPISECIQAILAAKSQPTA